MAGRYKTPLLAEYAPRIERAQIALLTGWPFDVIDALGFRERQDLLQVHEAQQKIEAEAAKSAKGRRR